MNELAGHCGTEDRRRRRIARGLIDFLIGNGAVTWHAPSLVTAKATCPISAKGCSEVHLEPMRDAKILKDPVRVYYRPPQARKFCVVLDFVVFSACSEARSLPGAEIISPVRTGTGVLHRAFVIQ